MSVSSSTYTVDGKRVPVASYRCNHEHCTARASIRGIDLDPFVVRTLFRMLRLVGTTGVRVPGRPQPSSGQPGEALEAAEYDRGKLVENRELRRLLTADEYNRELVALAEAVEEARIALQMAEADHEAPRIENVEQLWKEWTDETRREWLREMVESIEVASARRRRNIPLPERVSMSFRGLDEPLLERTEEDIKDRRRRLEAFRQRVRPKQRGATNASSSRGMKAEGDGD